MMKINDNFKKKPSIKQINQFINEIKGQKHTQQQYRQSLEVKQIHAKEIKNQQIQQQQKIKIKILSVPKYQYENLCVICYQQIGFRRIWCQICGHYICKQCLSRSRQIQNKIINFCQVCDENYLKGKIYMQFIFKYELMTKGFLQLANELENLDQFVSTEEKKIPQDNTNLKEIITNSLKITELLKENDYLKQQIHELNIKTTYGKQVNSKLRKKKYRINKIHRGSFNTSQDSNYNQEYNIQQKPPKAQSSQYLNQSQLNQQLIKSILQTQLSAQPTKKCNCQLM